MMVAFLDGRHTGIGIVNVILYRWKCAIVRKLYARVPFAVGQLRGSESPERSRAARLTVFRVDPDERYGEIVAMVPSGTWVPMLGNTQGEHALFLMTRSALRRSVTKLICRNAPCPDAEDEYRRFLTDYRRGEAGIFDRPSANRLKVYSILEQREQRLKGQKGDGSADSQH